ncbi:MAG: hypothetical protein JNM72_05580 [Deltaproteobacteria bacterium]|nr:hypothetical protein [Deltaproteobacteria bacterium]
MPTATHSPPPTAEGAPEAQGPADIDEATRRAISIVGDTIGELMGFWNFKPSMGKVWSVLYLSRSPLCAEEIVAATDLSAGSVSMTIQELLAWGVIRRAEEPVDRKRRFEAETDILSLVTRVFRERELRLIEDVVRRLELALRLIEGARSSSPELVLRQRFLATRIQQLLGLARLGASVVARFAQGGTLDLRSLRDALAARR